MIAQTWSKLLQSHADEWIRPEEMNTLRTCCEANFLRFALFTFGDCQLDLTRRTRSGRIVHWWRAARRMVRLTKRKLCRNMLGKGCARDPKACQEKRKHSTNVSTRTHRLTLAHFFARSHTEQLQLPLFALLLSSPKGLRLRLSLFVFFFIVLNRGQASSNDPSRARHLQSDLCLNQRLTPIPTSAKSW
jgi:hypothetical protein